MSNAEDCGSCKLFAYEFLDRLFSNYVDICCRFVKDNDLIAAENGSNYANELTLTNTQIFALFLHFEVEAIRLFGLFVLLLIISCFAVFI